MNFKYFYLFIISLFLVTNLKAQSTGENSFHDEEPYSHSNLDWVPGLLDANVSPLYNFVVYNGRIFSWNLRGVNQVAKIIDGIDWHSNIQQWNGDHLFIGMNYVFKRTAVLMNGAMSNNGYWTYPTLNVLSSENTTDKKSFSIVSTFSNTSNVNQTKSILLLSRSGLHSSKINTTYAIKIEDAPVGVLPFGYKKLANVFFSLDKKLKLNNTIGLSFLWNYLDQGRAATTVNEAFVLSQQRVYSPNWGWYHQQVYFPSTKQINTPLITLRYKKKWDENNFLTLNNGILFGKEAQSNLEWTHTADPRPDYYKYMPSYAGDSALRTRLKDWYIQHPQALQIQFDQLERINKASAEKRSYYIVNQQNIQMLMLHGSLLYMHLIKKNLTVQSGFQYAWDQMHYYNTIKDLLGGNYYYNYNTWMNDDDLALSFQNDINQPNKKIKQGEKWGADYSIQSFQIHPWVQIQKQGPIFESAIAIGYGLEGLQRNGYNQNGLFENSKGKSEYHYFTTSDAKAQLLYKLNGRLYFRTIAFAKWLAPNYQSLFVDPAINSFPSPYLLQESKYGADLSIFYRAPNFKTSLSLYQQYTFNASENKMFYHDAYTLFVYGVIGNMNSVQNGVEFVAETDLVQNIKINYVSTFSKSYFLNEPNYQYLDVNNLQIKETGLLQIKNLPTSSTPKMVQAISLIYQPVYGFTLGVTTLYAQDRAVALNLFRRSQWVKNKVDPITWSKIQNISLLEDQFATNAFVSKSFQFKSTKNKIKIYRWNMSISARNIFNALISIIAYEQTRFDYLKFNKDKFAFKYLMDAGTSYSLRIQLQIQ
jgi:hypothetical protein